MEVWIWYYIHYSFDVRMRKYGKNVGTDRLYVLRNVFILKDTGTTLIEWHDSLLQMTANKTDIICTIYPSLYYFFAFFLIIRFFSLIM